MGAVFPLRHSICHAVRDSVTCNFFPIEIHCLKFSCPVIIWVNQPVNQLHSFSQLVLVVEYLWRCRHRSRVLHVSQSGFIYSLGHDYITIRKRADRNNLSNSTILLWTGNYAANFNSEAFTSDSIWDKTLSTLSEPCPIRRCDNWFAPFKTSCNF